MTGHDTMLILALLIIILVTGLLALGTYLGNKD